MTKPISQGWDFDTPSFAKAQEGTQSNGCDDLACCLRLRRCGAVDRSNEALSKPLVLGVQRQGLPPDQINFQIYLKSLIYLAA